MPLYTCTEDGANKYWEITLSGTSFTTRWGKIGTKGQEKTQSFANAIDAKREYDKLIKEKTKKGYELAGGDDGDGDEDEEGEDTSGQAKRNPELEAAIEKEPDNVEGYLVYGDWLQSQGDPRGELIALQCAAHQATDAEEAKKLKKQGAALVRKYKEYLLGSLAGQEENEVSVEWRFGFIKSARLAVGDFDSDFKVDGALERLMTLPSARFLRELTLGMADFDSENDYTRIVETLAQKPCPTLERLFIGDYQYPDDTEISWTHLNDISSLYKALPGLRSLRLRGGSLALGEVNLPELREFTVETGGLPLGAVQSIAKANWPKLERLEVWFGEENYGAEGGVEDIQPLLDGQGLPRLKHLGLRNASFSPELCEALPRAKILAQLESLDLSMGILVDDDVEGLTKNAAAFKHLKRLDVTENLLSGDGEKQAAKICASVAAGNQRESYGSSDDRYVAVGE